MKVNEYEKFLELSEDERFEYLIAGIKLHWYQRLYIKIFNKWWTYMRNENPHLAAKVLWESIYKGRF